MSPCCSPQSGSCVGQGKWWARQDSNLQPDRYERPALTVELRARRRFRTESEGICLPADDMALTAIHTF